MKDCFTPLHSVRNDVLSWRIVIGNAVKQTVEILSSFHCAKKGKDSQ